MCTDKECKKNRKTFKNIFDLKKLLKQLDKCEMCVYRQNKNTVKEKTYKTIRLLYVEKYNTATVFEKKRLANRLA